MFSKFFKMVSGGFLIGFPIVRNYLIKPKYINLEDSSSEGFFPGETDTIQHHNFAHINCLYFSYLKYLTTSRTVDSQGFTTSCIDHIHHGYYDRTLVVTHTSLKGNDTII